PSIDLAAVSERTTQEAGLVALQVLVTVAPRLEELVCLGVTVEAVIAPPPSERSEAGRRTPCVHVLTALDELLRWPRDRADRLDQSRPHLVEVAVANRADALGLLDTIDDRARHEDLVRHAVGAADVASANSAVDSRPAEIKRDRAAVGCWARRSVGDIDEDLHTPVPAPAITSATLHRRGLDARAIGEGAVHDHR